MRGEPEVEIRFQREMSLKPTGPEVGILLVNDYQHAEPREADVERDGGVRRRQPEVDIVCGRGRSHLWFHRSAPESPTVSTVEQRPTRYCTAVSVQNERAEPSANDPFDCPLDQDSPGAGGGPARQPHFLRRYTTEDICLLAEADGADIGTCPDRPFATSWSESSGSSRNRSTCGWPASRYLIFTTFGTRRLIEDAVSVCS